MVLSILAAVSYGVVHDQVTVRVYLEYFSLGHEPVFETTDPTLLALGFGTLASWWLGLLLAVPLLLAARVGSRPKLGWRDLLKPIAILLLMIGFTAFIAGLVGFGMGRTGLGSLLEATPARVPQSMQARYLADAFAHTTAYAVGVLEGGLVCLWTLREGRRRSTAGKPLL